MLAIRMACSALGGERLVGCGMYVTLEPCPMCAMAISAARIARLCYGASDPKSGGVAQGPCIFEHPQGHDVTEIHEGVRGGESERVVRECGAGRRE